MTLVSDFKGHLCWEPSDVKETVFVDAASPSEAVFVATHQPPVILRRPFGAHEGGRRVTEHDLLREFMRPDADMILLPILGEAGTGKSHLVRWLYAHQDKDDPRRRVIYVPKQGTSLRHVLYLILDGMEGAEAAALRSELDDAQDLDERTAPDDLLDALARRVRLLVADMDDDHVDHGALVGLPDLLQDPFFREHFTAPGTVLRRFVERAMGGSRQGDEGEAFVFRTTDLPVDVRANDASRRAREAIQRLRWPQPAETAARVLTEQLGPALQAVFGLEGTTTLRDVMLKTRRSLAEQGRELVLLIEDFTVLQGIQRDLLDALTEPPIQNGKRELCPIRVTLAVTSGYWDTLANTVATRARFMTHVYDLNVPVVTELQGPPAGTAMIGRYLNAARRGAADIDRRWHSATEGGARPESWLGNACDDCFFKTDCHAAFGTSADGFGLYPFNADALRRMVATVSDEAYFDPRAVLGQVVRRTLEAYADDIRKGDFPNKDYGEAFADPARRLPDLPADVRYALNEYPDPERREVLLTIWGGAPNRVMDLAEGVHNAFQLPMVGVTVSVEDAVPTLPAMTHVVPPANAASRGLAQIDAWSAGTGVMDDGVARQLRQALLDGLQGRIDWDSALLHRGASSVPEVLTQASFVLEGRAAGGRTPGPRVWTCRIEANDRNGAMLRGLLRSRADGARTWDFPGGEDAYALYCNYLDEWATEAVEALRQDIGITDGGAGLAVTALAVGSAVLGRLDGETEADLLAAALRPATPDMIVHIRNRGGVLSRPGATATSPLRQSALDLLLHAAGARQGGGRVHALDAASFSHPLNRLAQSRDVSELLTEAAEPFAAALARELPGVVEAELRDLRRLEQSIAGLLGGDRDAPSLSETLRGSVTAAGTAAVFSPGHELSACLALCDDVARLRLGLLDEVVSLQQDAPHLGQAAVLSRLARFPRSEFVKMHDDLLRVSRYVDGSLRLAQQKRVAATGGGGGADDLRGVLAAITKTTQSLVEEL